MVLSFPWAIFMRFQSLDNIEYSKNRRCCTYYIDRCISLYNNNYNSNMHPTDNKKKKYEVIL